MRPSDIDSPELSQRQSCEADQTARREDDARPASSPHCSLGGSTSARDARDRDVSDGETVACFSDREVHVRHERALRHPVDEAAKRIGAVGAQRRVHIRHGTPAEQENGEAHEDAETAPEPGIGTTSTHTVNHLRNAVIDGARDECDVFPMELSITIDVNDHSGTALKPLRIRRKGSRSVAAIPRRPHDVGEGTDSAAGVVGRSIVHDDQGDRDLACSERGTDLGEESRESFRLVVGRYHHCHMRFRLHFGFPASVRSTFTRRFPRTCSV